MRVRLPKLVALTMGLAASTGCTWLISFDEIPRPDDGVDAEPPDGGDAAIEAAPREAGPADAGRADVDLTALASCQGKSNGLYCGNNQLVAYPGSRDDLVACDGGRVVAVTYCDRGAGCIRMANPRPDQCDGCWRLADGYWCGRDVAGWSAENANVRVQCQAGGLVDITPCSGLCVSNGARSSCQ
jgi:hypothetical protein